MMLLLDTHVVLWFLLNASQLSAKARALIVDPSNHKWVSMASCWEIAIKAGIGKLRLTEPAQTLLGRELPLNNFDILPITFSHAAAVETLPHHHRDPFDRLLAVQSRIEGMSLVSADAIFDHYGVHRLW